MNISRFVRAAVSACAIAILPVVLVGCLPVRLVNGVFSEGFPDLPVVLLRFFFSPIVFAPAFFVFTFLRYPVIEQVADIFIWILPIICALVLLYLFYRYGRRAIRLKRSLFILAFIGILLFSLQTEVSVPLIIATGSDLHLVEFRSRLMATTNYLQNRAGWPECEYEILGWTQYNQLIYRKWCEGYFAYQNSADGTTNPIFIPGNPNPSRQFDPITNQDFLLAEANPSLVDTTLKFTCVMPTWQSDRGLEDNHYAIKKHLDSYYSKDGKWVAIAREQMYGSGKLMVFRCL